MPAAVACPTLGAALASPFAGGGRAKPMANRSAHRSRPVVELRRTIDCLPLATREAMLAGVRAGERIIVGAYVDGRGGVCPMLAAHRRGGRTNFLSFARAWDRFTGAGRKARRATPRELAILAGALESSLARESPIDLQDTISEHRRLTRRRIRAQADTIGEILIARARGGTGADFLGDAHASPPPHRAGSPVGATRR